MNRNKRYSLFLSSVIFFFLSCTNQKQALELAAVFSDHMVLQQQSLVPIWGKGQPGETVTVDASWDKKLTTTVDATGNWKLNLQTPAYGGPFTITILCETDQVVFDDVLIGEVWLTSGQSNMEWPMRARILNQEEEIAEVNFPKIRMFSVPRNLNGTNINTASWKVATSENAPDFSAVGYFFARELHQKLEVPVGILNSSWGGTRVEAWTSIEKLAGMEASAEEANEILGQGGLEAIRQNAVESNSQIRQSNETVLKAKSYAVPESIEAWESLDLGDLEFAAPEHDDSDWSVFNTQTSEKPKTALESVFTKGSFAEDGAFWLRKTFDLKNPSAFSHFVVEGGIDDFDYTYLNGKQIGQGFSCCTGRSYEIPAGLLKKEGNVLAIRVVDTAGESGFRGAAYLAGDQERIELDSEPWRFKHIAYFLNTSFQKHNFTFAELSTQEETLKKQLKKGILVQNPNTYSVLFNTMIQPVLPYQVKGFLWYQGESNVGNYKEYQSLFTGMITDWREKWGQKLPFYFVQIAPFRYAPEAESQALREAQRKTLALEKTGMAVTLDIGEEDDIHPANKQDVGKRLARLALANDYGKSEVLASGPLYKSQKLYPSYIDLDFDYVGSGLMAKGALQGFEIAGSDSVFYPTTAKILDDKVRVSSRKVKNPKHVRYGWKNYFEATLFNAEGLPASSFQTP